MNASEHATGLIRRFGRHLGIEDLEFDADGLISFDIDSAYSLFIGIEPDATAVTLYAPIPGSETSRGERLLERLLTANFMWQATQGATLSIDAEAGFIVLHRRLHVEHLSDEAFAGAAETFVNTLQSVSARVANGMSPGDTPEPPGLPLGGLRA